MERLAALEPWLKRAIPVLIIIFLAVVFASRAIALMNARDVTAQTAHMQLDMLAQTESFAFQDASRNGFEPATEAEYEDILMRNLPSGALMNGRQFLIADEAGVIFVQRGGDADYRGKHAGTLIGGDIALTMFGAGAGVRSVVIDDQAYLASAASIPSATVYVLQSEAAIFEEWRQRVSMNVTLYTATSAVLLMLLYAYFAQVARAREADTVYWETQLRVDTALTRGACGLWDWDLARGRIYWSRSMFELLGFSPVEGVLSFGEINNLLHPDDADLFDIAERVASHEISGLDQLLRMRKADGSYARLRIRTQVVERAGRGNHLIGIAVDVSEQHRLSEQSEQASANLQAAIESTSESFALWDAEDRLVLCNKKFFEYSGLQPDGVAIGDKRADVLKQMRPALVERRIPNSELGVNGKTFERQVADGRWLQINERSTSVGGTISVGTDITQLKLQEEKLTDNERQLMASVERLSELQTAEQQKAEALGELNLKFLQAKERAEAANSAKTQFLANVSHELRTPLNAIIGFSEMMQARMFGPLGSERYEEYIEDIHQSGTFLLNVINDILDMSKIESGKIVLERDTIDLKPLIDETLQMVCVQAGDKNIKMLADISDGMSIVADRRAMKQIVLNLLSNAVKFTPNGGQVRIRTKCVSGSIQITIEDNGCGMSKAALRRIGRPFEQAQNQFSKDHTGTGLGLAISRSLAELHNGSLKVRSREGEGTIVAVRIPKGCAQAV